MAESENPNLVYKNDTGLHIYELRGKSLGAPLSLGHYYSVEWEDKEGEPCHRIVAFQDGPIPANGVNGLTSEALLAILIHRTETLNGQFPCDENELAILHMKKALEAFDARTAKRRARGVEGQLKA